MRVERRARIGSWINYLLALVMAGASVAAHAGLPASWSIIEVGPFAGEASAVSDNGLVVGNAVAPSGKNQAFIWNNGRVDLLSPDLPDVDSYAYAVNNAGMVGGMVDGAAVVWRDRTLIQLAVRGAARAINETGIVAGVIRLTEVVNPPTHAFMWKDGVLTDLHPAGATTSSAVAINENGQIAGSVDGRAVIWQDGVMRELGFKPFTVGAINDRGEVTGMHVFGDDIKSTPYIYNGVLNAVPGGPTNDLSSLAITNGDRLLVNGVDGYATVIEGSQRVSFEFMPAMRAAGWKRLEPRAMNDRGWIVGFAAHDGYGRPYLIRPEEAASGNPLARPSSYRHLAPRSP